MKYALVNGVKTPPSPKSTGVCSCCNEPVIAKCGEIKVWHWAHTNLDNCDNWWEPETEWHRVWKSHFPIDNQEVIQIDPLYGEKHIADVMLNNGVVIEFQNSPISPEEITCRELFYNNMIWVINGDSFKHHFTIRHKLPNHKSNIVKNCRREYIHQSMVDVCEVWIKGRYRKYFLFDAQEFLVNDDSRMYSFLWNYERKSWRYSKKMKFIDFGDDYLYQIMRYNDSLECVKLWTKSEFVKRALNPKK